MNNITAIVHTKNSAQTFDAALDSLRWVDHILVADMESTDETIAIAKKYGATIFQVPVHDYVEPVRQLAIDKTTTDWVFLLDADERVPADLATQLRAIADSSSADVVRIARKNIIFGSWMEHAGWWPDYQVRFFKRKSLQWPKSLHAQPDVSGNVKTLAAQSDLAIEHFNYPTVHDFIERMHRYTDIAAQESQKDKEVVKDVPTTTTLIEAYSSELNSRLFATEGWKSGERGVIVSYLQAVYMLIAQAKLWELQKAKTVTSGLDELLAQLHRSRADSAYWLADLEVKRTTGLLQWWWRIRRRIRL